MFQSQDRVTILLRHGDTGAHNRNVVGGRSENLPLQPRGERQAVAAGRILLPSIARILHASGLAGINDRVQIGDFSVSPTERTKATAAGLALGTYEEDERITEWSKGHTEGLERALVETSEYKQRALEDGWYFRPDSEYQNPTSETPGEVQDRGFAWLEERPTYPAESILRVSLGVTHGYLTSFLLAKALHHETPLSPQEAVATYLPDYASGYVLVSRYDRWAIAGLLVAPAVA